MLFAGMLTEIVEDNFGDTHGLVAVPSTTVVTIFHIFEANALIFTAMRARERDQTPTVKVMVREGDQCLIGAAIVPFDAARLKVRTETLIQDALRALILFGRFFFLLILSAALVRQRFREEARRRKLPGIADDNQLVAAQNGGDAVFRTDLRRLVKYHQVEELRARLHILADT